MTEQELHETFSPEAIRISATLSNDTADTLLILFKDKLIEMCDCATEGDDFVPISATIMTSLTVFLGKVFLLFEEFDKTTKGTPYQMLEKGIDFYLDHIGEKTKLFIDEIRNIKRQREN